MAGYTKRNKLGEGAFGEVYRVTKQGSNQSFVMKIIQDKNAVYEVSQEVAVLRGMHHPNIVTYIESFRDAGGYPCIIMEFCEGGTLRETFDDLNRRRATMPEATIAVTFRELCNAVAYVHSRNVIHRDIKPENILFTSGKILKLGDFGISKIMARDAKYTDTLAGTPYYMAPEVLTRKEYNNKCDIWSMGCVLYEMASLEPAFSDDDDAIESGHYAALPARVGRHIKDLVAQLIRVNPRERPTAGAILAGPFVQA